ncbi:hypothetical protein Nepgr_019329 [Nepenthes gracilis]|uniref:Uncharacterized protein n=1 Tax=Nepenthes gracilis TaxID=150966 RepID=A0AAD3XU98_NEPGR|nr:hypothetical protein Nepgr_019329 [Nepenthes gracilis]
MMEEEVSEDRCLILRLLCRRGKGPRPSPSEVPVFENAVDVAVAQTNNTGKELENSCIGQAAKIGEHNHLVEQFKHEKECCNISKQSQVVEIKLARGKNYLIKNSGQDTQANHPLPPEIVGRMLRENGFQMFKGNNNSAPSMRVDLDNNSGTMTTMSNTAFGKASVSSTRDQLSRPKPPPKKKRNQPKMLGPDAEVITLPKTLIATNRFMCEIYNKGFQQDQNL